MKTRVCAHYRLQEWFERDGSMCIEDVQHIISQGAQLKPGYYKNVVWIEAVAKTRPDDPMYWSSTEEVTDSSDEVLNPVSGYSGSSPDIKEGERGGGVERSRSYHIHTCSFSPFLYVK
jgi:hypothetical protein